MRPSRRDTGQSRVQSMWFLIFLCLWLVPGAWAKEPAQVSAKKPSATLPVQGEEAERTEKTEPPEKTEKKALATVARQASAFEKRIEAELAAAEEEVL